MTKKNRKKDHNEIKDRLAEPKTQEDHDQLANEMYGDENNPGAGLHTGEDWNINPQDPQK